MGVLIMAAAAVAVGAPALAGAPSSAGSSAAAQRAQAGPAPVTFSHEVPVDQQRAGFEPDVKVGTDGSIYTSVPAGFLLTRSFLWSSHNQGNSYSFVPGAIGDKTLTCIGGGDTELALDGANNLLFSDLQGLTNLSNSVSTDQGRTFTTTCAGATNTPVDRMWYAVKGTLGQPGFVLYEDYDAVVTGATTSGSVGNQLVEEYSTDGITFKPVVNTNPVGSDCLGLNATNCVTNNEGISGNQVIAPNGDILIAHSSATSNQVIVSRGVVTDTPAGKSAVWTNTVIDPKLCPDVDGVEETCGATTFATIAEDSAGHFYTVFAAEPGKSTAGTFTGNGPENVYVASSLDGKTWNAPVRVSGTGNNAFPWVTAGSGGRVAVAWYHANEASQNGSYTFDALTHAEFSVQTAESFDALSTTPGYTVSTVSEHPIKYGPICTSGLGCSVNGGDRSLGDYLQVNHDSRGALIVSYVDDTSQAYTPGALPGSAIYNQGPSVISRQIAGPSLLGGTITGPAGGPGLAMNAVTNPAGQDAYNGAGQTLPAGPAFDLRAASLSRDVGGGLLATLKVSSLSSLSVPLPIPGTTGLWLLKWTDYVPGVPGNGHIYYAGMQSVAGGAPTFFDGDVTHDTTGQDLYLAYPATNAIKGSYNPNGTITLHIPSADVGSPTTGHELYSALGFTASSPTPLSTSTVFNQLDATTPFDVILKAAPAAAAGTAGAAGSTGGAGGAGGSASGRGELAFTGIDEGLVGGLALAAIGAGLALRRRRHDRTTL